MLAMFHLIHSPPGDVEFLGRRFLRLFYKLVQDNNSAIRHRAIQDPCNAHCGFQPKFKQSSAHGPSVGHAQIWTIGFHSLGIPEKPGEKAWRESENIMFHESAVGGDATVTGALEADH